jgi:hypothetical protein
MARKPYKREEIGQATGGDTRLTQNLFTTVLIGDGPSF